MTRDIEHLVPRLDQVRGLARSLVRDAAAADDLVQDAVVAALGRGGAEPVGVGWLRAAVRSLAIDRARSEKARLRRERSVASRETGPDASEHVERAERSRDLVDAVLGLDEPNRTAVILRHLEGLPPREIARRTGASVPTVKKRIERGLGVLRERLESRYGGGGQWAVALLPLAGRDVLVGLGASASASAAASASAGAGATGGGAPSGAAGLLAGAGGSRVPAIVLTVAFLAAGGAAWYLLRSGPDGLGDDPASAARIAAADASPSAAQAADVGTREALDGDSASHGDAPAGAAAGDERAPLVPERIDAHFVGLDGRPLIGLEVAWTEGAGGLPPMGMRIASEAIEITERTPGAHGDESADSAGSVPSGGSTEVTVTTDAAGVAAVPRFALDELQPASNDRVRLVQGREEGSERDVVVLAPAVDLAGVCVGPDGAPVAHAELQIAARANAIAGFPIDFASTGRQSHWRTTADTEGRFELPRVATHAAFELWAQRPGEDRYVSVAVPEASDRAMRVELEEPRPRRDRPRVFGRVLGPDGAPSPGAVVRLGDTPARTDAVGRYEIEVRHWPDGCPLVASGDGGVFVRGPVPDEPDARTDAGAGPYDLTLPAEMPRLGGVVVTPDGRPLDGLRVFLIDATRDGASSRMYEEARGDGPLGVGADTDDRGAFEFPRVAPRPYSLRVIDLETFVSHDARAIDPRAGEARIVFPGAAAAPPLSGRIVDVHGAPAVGLEVSLSIATLYLPGGGHSSTVGPKATTDDTGAFEFAHVPRAGATLSIKQAGDPSGQSLSSLATDALGESVDVQVELRCEVVIQGEGRPDVDRVVFLGPDGGGVTTITVRSGVLSFGRGTLARLPSGAFPLVQVPQSVTQIELRSDGAEPERVQVHLDPYRTNEIDL